MHYMFLLKIVLDILSSLRFTSLVKFIPKYFIVFDVIMNGIVFFISFSDNSFLLCRNAIDFVC